jgi:hypothetical protein
VIYAVFFNKYLTTYDNPPLWASIDQEALSIGKDFAIRLYVAIAHSHPNPVPLNSGWPDPRAKALQMLNHLQYAGLNALLVPLITPGSKNTDSSRALAPTLAAVRAVLPASGNRSDEPTAALRQKLMTGLALDTVEWAGRSNPYLAALSTLDGEPWGPDQLYVRPSGTVKNLYIRVFRGLTSADVAKYIDMSLPETRDFSTVRQSLVACSDPDNNVLLHERL